MVKDILDDCLIIVNYHSLITAGRCCNVYLFSIFTLKNVLLVGVFFKGRQRLAECINRVGVCDDNGNARSFSLNQQHNRVIQSACHVGNVWRYFDRGISVHG